MNLSFKKIKLNENQEYEAVVHDVVVNKKKGMLWVFVELDEIRNDIVNIGLHFFLKNVRPYAASCSEA